MDQGVRTFRFVLNAGTVAERMSAVGREAETANESPFAINIFPTGSNRKRPPKPGLQVSDPAALGGFGA